jgi:hypothetical protein
MRRKNHRHGIIAAAREVCKATRHLGDGSCLNLRHRVRGSARAVRSVRNSRVFQMETRVVADRARGVSGRNGVASGIGGLCWPDGGAPSACVPPLCLLMLCGDILARTASDGVVLMIHGQVS